MARGTIGGVVLAVGLALGASQTAQAQTQQCSTGPFVAGVDVSGGEGTLDWTSAAGAGIKFAFMKATQGNYYTDSEFTANWTGTKAAGIVRGAYHFFDGTISGADQASYFLQTVGTIEPTDLPPVLDIECPDGTPGDDCLGNGGSGAASSTVLTQGMNDFLTAVKAATGRTPIVYSYESWFSDNGIDTTGLTSYPLWIAYPTTSSCFEVPPPWTSATFWQYSFTGDVPGIGSGGDLDYFLGTMANFTTFLSSGVSPIVDAGLPPDDAGGDAGVPCDVPDIDASGTCILTTECSAIPGHMSTPGYCPGADDIQCCTGPNVDSGVHDSGSPTTMDGGAPSRDGGSTPDATTDAGGGTDGAVVAMEDSGRSVSEDGGQGEPGHGKGGCGCRAALTGKATDDVTGHAVFGLLLLGAGLARRRARQKS